MGLNCVASTPPELEKNDYRCRVESKGERDGAGEQRFLPSCEGLLIPTSSPPVRAKRHLLMAEYSV